MKYMTFNNSCSFAGLANMLKMVNIDTEDYKIALAMKLPYIVSKNEHGYLSGAMLQTKEWFSLYLKPLGYEIKETFLEKDEVIPYLLLHQPPMMLGVHVIPSLPNKHAIIFIGFKDEKFIFINNKRKDSNEAEKFIWSKEDLLKRLDNNVTIVGSLETCNKEKIDFTPYLKESLHYIKLLLKDIYDFISVERNKKEIMEAMKALFRAALLDNIAVLKLTNHKELVSKLETVQSQLLKEVRSDYQTIKLIDHLDFGLLKDAFNKWSILIKHQI